MIHVDPQEAILALPQRFRVQRVLSARPSGGSVLVVDGGLRLSLGVLKWHLIRENGAGEDKGGADSFERFTRILEGLKSRYLSAPYTHGVVASPSESEIGYYVRPFVPGYTLSSMRCPMPEAWVVRAGAQVAAALAVLHAHKIVHGDLTPNNVIVRRAGRSQLDEHSECVLIDVSYRHPQLTHPQKIDEVAIQYVAPEVTMGASPDSRADLFSLGVVLYWMATGHCPYQGQALSEIINNKRLRSFMPLETRQPSLSGQFRRIVEALLEPNPDARTGSAEMVQSQLRALLPADTTSISDVTLPITDVTSDRTVLLRSCVDSLSSTEHAVVLEVAAPPNAGVTSFLRDIEDLLTAANVALVSVDANRHTAGALAEHLDAVVARSLRAAEPAGSERGSTPVTRLLDDVAALTRRKRLVVLVDDWTALGSADKHLLQRLVAQEKQRAVGVTGTRAGLSVCLGSHEGQNSAIDATDDAIRSLADRSVEIPPLAVDDVTEVLSREFPGLQVPRALSHRMLQVTGGHPGLTRALLERMARRQAGSGALRAEDLEEECARFGHGDGMQAVQGAPGSGVPSAAEAVLMIWRGPMKLATWTKVCEALGWTAVRGRSAALHEYRERHGEQFVQSRARLDLRHLEKMVAEDLASSFAGVRLAATLSADLDSAATLINTVAGLGAVPPVLKWPTVRAALQLLRHGRLGEAATLGRAVRGRDSSRSSSPWLRLLVMAAEAEATLTRDAASEMQMLMESETRSISATANYIVGRHLARARDYESAVTHLKMACALAPDGATWMRSAITEDLGLCLAELGDAQGIGECARILCAATRHATRGPSRCISNPKRGVVHLRYLRLRSRMMELDARYLRAAGYARAEVARCKGSGVPTREAAALNNVGVALIKAGRYTAALETLESCATARETHDDERGLVGTLNNLAVVHTRLGHTDKAIGLLRRVVALAARNGLQRHRLQALLNIAHLYVQCGQLKTARRTYWHLLNNSAGTADRDVRRRAHINLVQVLLDLCWWSDAARSLKAMAASGTSYGRGVQTDVAWLRCELAARTGKAEDIQEAQDALRDCADIEHNAKAAVGQVLKADGVGRTGRSGYRRSRIPLLWRVRDTCRRLSGRGRLTCVRTSRIVLACLEQKAVREALEAVRQGLREAQGEEDQRHLCHVALRIIADAACKEGHDDAVSLLCAEIMAKRVVLGSALHWKRAAAVLIERLARMERYARRRRDSEDVANRIARDAYATALGVSRQHAVAGSAPSMYASRIAKALLGEVLYLGDSAKDEGQLVAGFCACLVDAGSARAVAQLLESVRVSIGAELVAYIEVGSEGPRIVARADREQDRRDLLSWAIVSQVVQSGQSVVFQDALTARELAEHRSVTTLNLRSIACVPVGRGGRTIGVVYADHSRLAGQFGSSQVQELSCAGVVIGVGNDLASLRLEVSDSQRKIETMGDRAVEIERHRIVRESLSGVLHDLKNTITAISARVELAQKGDAGALSTRSMEGLIAASDHARRLISKADGVLRGKRENGLGVVRLHAVVTDVLEMVEHRVRKGRGVDGGGQTKLTVSRSGDGVVRGDKDELREVILNLVINSLDAMPMGGDLNVSVRSDEREGFATIAVADTGMGMTEEVQRRAFEPFFTTKGASGTGLGLAVVRSIVANHGGEVFLESSPGKGTRVTVRLPSYREHGSDVASPQLADGGAA